VACGSSSGISRRYAEPPRHGLRDLIGFASDTEVVGEVATGEEAVACAGALQPEVVLMDIRMPGLSGIEATRRIVGECPPAPPQR
jgi:DNA-binding NarL/FixJ family response regulator